MLDDDIVVVYDCKNISDYVPSAEDRRKLKEYIENAKLKYVDKNIYGVFIAKSFADTQKGDTFYFPISSLVYLLYKKMVLGRKFDLAPFRKIFARKDRLSRTLIGNEWKTFESSIT